MKLYNANASPNALRTRAVVFELGLTPEIINIDIGKGENRTPEYLAINPNGKVPALVDGEVKLWESRAINAYLASKKPEAGLYPDDAVTRAMIDQWSYWQAIHLGPAMQRVAFERVQKKLWGRGEADEAAIAGELKTVAELLPILDAALVGKDWLVGSLSLADFSVASTFMLRRPARLGVEAFANVTAWIERMETRESWTEAVLPMLDLLRARGAEL
jgi:glutathione S-transferase